MLRDWIGGWRWNRALGLRGALGPRGERVAARYLKRAGYRIVQRNLRTRLGEIDLLAEADDRRTLVIVEVKSATDDAIPPEHHVNRAKQRKLASLAASLGRRDAWRDRPVRFDVVTVIFPPRGRRIVRHHIGAFESHL